MALNRRNIIQFKPEGTANIFAPMIRINGRTAEVTNTPSASNGLYTDMASYPQTQTVSSNRVTLAQESATTDDFNKIFSQMFGNYLTSTSQAPVEEPAPVPATTDQSNQYSIGNNQVSGNLAQVIAGLSAQTNCRNNNGHCTHKNNCASTNVLGNCYNENTVCCKNTLQPNPNANGTENNLQSGNSYSNQVTGPNAGTGSAAGQSGQSSQSQTPSPSSSLNSLYGSRIVTTDSGIINNYCELNCGRVLKEYKENEDGTLKSVPPYWEWRPYTQGCKDNNCPNDGSLDAGDINKDGIPDAVTDDDTLVTRYQTYTKKKALNDECPGNNCCRNLSQSQCNTNKKCFYCISSRSKNDRMCTKIDATGNYVCDSQNVGACVPLYKQGNNVVPYTEGPFQELAKFTYNKEDLPDKTGKQNVLDYPYLGQCKGPIKAELNQEDIRKQLKNEYRSQHTKDYINPYL